VDSLGALCERQNLERLILLSFRERGILLLEVALWMT